MQKAGKRNPREQRSKWWLLLGVWSEVTAVRVMEMFYTLSSIVTTQAQACLKPMNSQASQ